MEIIVDQSTLLTLTDHQKNVMKHYVNDDIFTDDINRRVAWAISNPYCSGDYTACASSILGELYKRAFINLKREWDSKLIAIGEDPFPTDEEEYATLVFSQGNYKDKKTRDDDEEEE